VNIYKDIVSYDPNSLKESIVWSWCTAPRHLLWLIILRISVDLAVSYANEIENC
jgi:hypothetical protein